MGEVSNVSSTLPAGRSHALSHPRALTPTRSHTHALSRSHSLTLTHSARSRSSSRHTHPAAAADGHPDSNAREEMMVAGRGRVGGRSHPDSNAREEMMLICGCRRRARARTASTSLPSSLGAREVGTVRSPARAAGVDLARTHLQLQRRRSILPLGFSPYQ